jgi:hypothetical protein
LAQVRWREPGASPPQHSSNPKSIGALLLLATGRENTGILPRVARQNDAAVGDAVIGGVWVDDAGVGVEIFSEGWGLSEIMTRVEGNVDVGHRPSGRTVMTRLSE